MTPTARSLLECRRRGWSADKVEQTIPHGFIKRDLFGCLDIVALTNAAILGIQVTSGSNHSSRVKKIVAEPRMKLWIDAGGQIAVWSWSKRGGRGDRKRWALREESITGERFECASDAGRVDKEHVCE